VSTKTYWPNLAITVALIDRLQYLVGFPTDGTRPHWVRVEPNQTRTHVLKSCPPPAPAPAPAPASAAGYTFCSIPTPARVKKPAGNTHQETTQQANII
jgi:hypothetical protein